MLSNRYGKRSRTWLGAIGVVAVALSVGACGGDPFALSSQSAVDHRARWVAAGVTDYEYDYSRDCVCVLDTERAVRVQVRNGRVADAAYSDTGERAGAEATFPTVEKLFEVIDDAILREAQVLVVSYESQLGYPTDISIDFDSRVPDDEIEIRVRGFVALEKPTTLRSVSGNVSAE